MMCAKDEGVRRTARLRVFEATASIIQLVFRVIMLSQLRTEMRPAGASARSGGQQFFGISVENQVLRLLAKR